MVKGLSAVLNIFHFVIIIIEIVQIRIAKFSKYSLAREN